MGHPRSLSLQIVSWVGLASVGLGLGGLGCAPKEPVGSATVGAAGTGTFGGAGTVGSAGTVGGAGTVGSAGTRGVPLDAGLGGAAGTSVCSSGGSGTPMTRGEPVPSFGATVRAATAPPAVSGGTLQVLSDGITAVAADPDRDRVYVVDLPARAVRATIALHAGDEPGRLVEDGGGRVHVVLRHGGAIATLDAVAGTVSERRTVCAAPRGIAYDRATDLVHVACRDGELVSLPAAGGEASRTLTLDRDLRDVVVSGGRLLVSRFRSAELLTVDADGTVSGRASPPAFRSTLARANDAFTPSVAWRTLAAPDGTVVMLHQRGDTGEIRPVPGGYGGQNPCDSILHPAVTAFAADGTASSGPALAGLVLAVDMAISPDGGKVAFVSTGNATNRSAGATTPQLTRVFETSLSTAVDGTIGCNPDGVHGPCPAPGVMISAGGRGGATTVDGGAAGAGGVSGRDAGSSQVDAAADAGGLTGRDAGGSPLDGGTGVDAGGDRTGTPAACSTPDPSVPMVVGEPIAVAYAGDGSLVVQSREPALLAFADGTSVALAPDSRADTGHQIFHANSGAFVACASCHPEGNEDGRVWSFACSGPRRTQSLQTGLTGSEPFHWSGDEVDFTHLMADVFVGRMSGPALATDQASALLAWLDAQPRPPHAMGADPAAVGRGRTLFNAANVGCATCHAGASLTSNQTVDVGTSGSFQVPSLVGVGSRAPYMHDGCAATLRDRFSPACGGTSHGATSQLSEDQISDLIAFLETL